MKTFLRKHWVKLLIGFLFILFAVLLWQKETILENKYTKAKLEIFKAALERDTGRIKEVIDSLEF